MRLFSLRIKSLFICCFITVFLSLSFFAVHLDKALAIESTPEHTAKLVEGAKKEGKVVWYSGMSLPETLFLLNKFKEKYPFIQTSVYRTDPEGLLSRIMAETQAKKHLFDLVHMGFGVMDEIIKRKGITRLIYLGKWG